MNEKPLIEEKYPEHIKLKQISDKSQVIGEFMDFSGYTLCEYSEELEVYMPVLSSISALLAKHFGIDEEKIEQEKRAMLAELRGD